MDDILGVALHEGPIPKMRPPLLAELGHEDVLLRVCVVHTARVFKADLSNRVRPSLVAWVPIAMEADAPDIPAGLRIREDLVRPSGHPVPVVVPHYELEVREISLLQGWSEVVPHKVPLLLRRIHTILPAVRALRLVLHGEAPKWELLLGHCLGELGIVQRPNMPALLPQLPAIAHPLVVLHPGRGTPRTSEELDRAARRLLRPLYQRYDVLLIMVDAEVPQLPVHRCLIAAPIAAREVAGVHVHTAEPVAKTSGGVVISLDDFVLQLFAENVEIHSRALCERTAESHERVLLHT
mmetsp:Transcript_32606/g.69454  ORF Transcript_32606/g.69454 Transcript_32606/m.69454 type:complete len:295 (+) Transcript_32606:341-1225(+)